MTPQQILNKVNEKASVQFPEVIERVFSNLRDKHTHKCNLRQCDCDYCNFINRIYTKEKLKLHRYEKELKYIVNYEYWYSGCCTEIFNFSPIQSMNRLILKQMIHINELAENKKMLCLDIL